MFYCPIGPVIGMEYCGDDIHIKCQEQLSVIMSGQPGWLFANDDT